MHTLSKVRAKTWITWPRTCIHPVVPKQQNRTIFSIFPKPPYNRHELYSSAVVTTITFTVQDTTKVSLCAEQIRTRMIQGHQPSRINKHTLSADTSHHQIRTSPWSIFPGSTDAVHYVPVLDPAAADERPVRSTIHLRQHFTSSTGKSNGNRAQQHGKIKPYASGYNMYNVKLQNVLQFNTDDFHYENLFKGEIVWKHRRTFSIRVFRVSRSFEIAKKVFPTATKTCGYIFIHLFISIQP